MTDTTQAPRLPDHRVTVTHKDGYNDIGKTVTETFGNKTVVTVMDGDGNPMSVVETVEETPAEDVRSKEHMERMRAMFEADRARHNAFMAVAPAALERIVNKPTREIHTKWFILAIFVSMLFWLGVWAVQS